MKQISAQRIVEILEERYAELEQKIDDVPYDAAIMEELLIRRREVCLLLLTIDTEVSE